MGIDGLPSGLSVGVDEDEGAPVAGHGWLTPYGGPGPVMPFSMAGWCAACQQIRTLMYAISSICLSAFLS
jgi:hypothetical protein